MARALRARSGKRGSSVDNARTLAALGVQLQARARKHAAAQRPLKAQFRRLFTRRELRLAAALVAEMRKTLRAANLASSDASSWDENRRRLRKLLERELSRSLPGYREWRRLQRRARRDRIDAPLPAIALLAPGSDFHIDFDDIVPADQAPQTFRAPFEIGEADQLGVFHRSLDWTDNGQAHPDQGHLMNDLEIVHSDDGNWAQQAIGLNMHAEWVTWAGCGVRYRMPVTGWLKITARLRNHFNHVFHTTQDQTGFSDSSQSIQVSLYVDILLDGEREPMTQLLVEHRLDSGGDEGAYVFPSIDTTAGHDIEARSQNTYQRSRTVDILVGCRICVTSEIDDMTNRARALLWWQLEELTVEPIEQVIL